MIVERMAKDLGLSEAFIASLTRGASHEYKVVSNPQTNGWFPNYPPSIQTAEGAPALAPSQRGRRTSSSSSSHSISERPVNIPQRRPACSQSLSAENGPEELLSIDYSGRHSQICCRAGSTLFWMDARRHRYFLQACMSQLRTDNRCADVADPFERHL